MARGLLQGETSCKNLGLSTQSKDVLRAHSTHLLKTN
jgi:hypothetical protein